MFLAIQTAAESRGSRCLYPFGYFSRDWYYDSSTIYVSDRGEDRRNTDGGKDSGSLCAESGILCAGTMGVYECAQYSDHDGSCLFWYLYLPGEEERTLDFCMYYGSGKQCDRLFYTPDGSNSADCIHDLRRIVGGQEKGKQVHADPVCGHLYGYRSYIVSGNIKAE